MLEEAELSGQALYLVPGHPLVAEETTGLLLSAAREKGWEDVYKRQPQEVFDYPANLFVAGFIGMPEMNLFEGELTKNAAGEYAVKLGPVSVALSADKQARLAGQGVGPWPVTIGVRPERIKLCLLYTSRCV